MYLSPNLSIYLSTYPSTLSRIRELTCLPSIHSQGVKWLPVFSNRVFGITYVITMFVTVTVYVAMLTATLTLPTLSPTLNTLEELVRSDFSWGIQVSFFFYYCFVLFMFVFGWLVGCLIICLVVYCLIICLVLVYLFVGLFTRSCIIFFMF